MKKFSIYGFCYKALWLIACAVCIFLLVLNFLYTAAVSYDAGEAVTISGHMFPSLAMSGVLAALLFLGMRTGNNIGRIREKPLFLTLSGLYAIMALYLIFHVDATLRADPYGVFSAAQAVLNGVFHTFYPGGYLYMFPHQVGMLLYDGMLSLISKSPVINFLVNFGFILGINFLSFKISDAVFHNKAVNVLTIICSFAFLPQFFFVLFAYGLIPGFFFMMLAFYHTVVFAGNHKILNLLGILVGVTGAVVLKENFLIGAIAIVIYLVLHCFKAEGKLKLRVIAILSVLICMVFPIRMLTAFCEIVTDAKLDRGMPSILWIALGTDIDNDTRAPGWSDASHYRIYFDAQNNVEKASEQGKQKILANLEKIRNEPVRAAKFFADKTISQWCDPLYQSIWSGPLAGEGQHTHTKLLQSIYEDGAAEDGIALFCKGLSLLLWFCACIFLILYHKETPAWQLMYMYCIGGLLFHTMWEGKSQYIYPYVFCLIPYAMYALWKILTWRQEKKVEQ